jgi:hypothetical protein
LEEALGAPLFAADSNGAKGEEYTKPDAGLERVTVWFDDDRVDFARVVLVNEINPRTAALLFDILGSSTRADSHAFTENTEGHTLHYASDGAHFFIVEGKVVEIWRTKRNADPVAIKKKAATTFPPPELEKSEVVDIRKLLGEDYDKGTPELDVSGAGKMPEPPVWDPNGGEAPKAAAELRRMIEVGPVTAQLVMDDHFLPILKITGPVNVHGFRNKEARIEGWLLPEDRSRVLLATKNAPAEFQGPRGSFRPMFQEKVLYDMAGWKEVTLSYPLKHVQGGLELGGRFVISLEVLCDDLAAFANAVVDVPGRNYTPTKPLPLVEMSPFVIVHAEHEKLGPGFYIYTPIRILNAKDMSMAGRATLWYPGRKPVLAAKGWDGWRGEQGEFYALDTVKVVYADASWESFQLFVPYDALALDPGPQKVIVRVQFTLPPLGAAREMEIEITIPER